jgi:hypothetical protein
LSAADRPGSPPCWVEAEPRVPIAHRSGSDGPRPPPFWKPLNQRRLVRRLPQQRMSTGLSLCSARLITASGSIELRPRAALAVAWDLSEARVTPAGLVYVAQFWWP